MAQHVPFSVVVDLYIEELLCANDSARPTANLEEMQRVVHQFTGVSTCTLSMVANSLKNTDMLTEPYFSTLIKLGNALADLCIQGDRNAHGGLLGHFAPIMCAKVLVDQHSLSEESRKVLPIFMDKLYFLHQTGMQLHVSSGHLLACCSDSTVETAVLNLCNSLITWTKVENEMGRPACFSDWIRLPHTYSAVFHLVTIPSLGKKACDILEAMKFSSQDSASLDILKNFFDGQVKVIHE